MEGEVTIALHLPRSAPDQHVRHIIMQMPVGVAHVAAIKDKRMVEQRGVLGLELNAVKAVGQSTFQI